MHIALATEHARLEFVLCSIDSGTFEATSASMCLRCVQRCCCLRVAPAQGCPWLESGADGACKRANGRLLLGAALGRALPEAAERGLLYKGELYVSLWCESATRASRVLQRQQGAAHLTCCVPAVCSSKVAMRGARAFPMLPVMVDQAAGASKF